MMTEWSRRQRRRCRRRLTATAAAAATAQAIYELEARTPEVDVDDAVQDEVDGEVQRLQHVGDDDRRVEHLDRVATDGVIVEVKQFGRRDEY